MDDICFGNSATYKLRIRSVWFHSFHRFSIQRYCGSERCYCNGPGCWEIRISIVLFGVGFHAWFSHFKGAIPCPCDLVMKELGYEDYQDIDEVKK